MKTPEKINEVKIDKNTVIHIKGIPFKLNESIKVLTSTKLDLLRKLKII